MSDVDAVGLDGAAEEGPDDGVGDDPASRAISVKRQLGGEAIEAAAYLRLGVPKLGTADDAGKRKLALAHEGDWIDHEPRPGGDEVHDYVRHVFERALVTRGASSA